MRQSMQLPRKLLASVLAGGLVFGLVGWLPAGIAPEKWYARAVLQAGLHGQLEPQPLTGQTPMVGVTPVESPHAMLERLNSPGFREEALRSKGLGEREDLRYAMKHRFAARVLPAAQLVEFRIRGATAQESRELAHALIDHLRAAHAKDVDPSVRSLERLLLEKRDEEKVLNRYISELEPAAVGKPAALQAGFASNAAFASLYVNEAQARLPRVRQEIISLETSLEAIARRKTGPLGAEVDVINEGWSRRRGVVTVAAVVLGSLLGGIAAMFGGRRADTGAVTGRSA